MSIVYAEQVTRMRTPPPPLGDRQQGSSRRNDHEKALAKALDTQPLPWSYAARQHADRE